MKKGEKWETVRERLMQKPGVAQEYAKLPPIIVAEQLIRARQEKGLTQAELAKLVGTCQPVISKLESGSYHRYTLRTLEKVAEVLDRTVEITFKPKAA